MAALNLQANEGRSLFETVIMDIKHSSVYKCHANELVCCMTVSWHGAEVSAPVTPPPFSVIRVTSSIALHSTA